MKKSESEAISRQLRDIGERHLQEQWNGSMLSLNSSKDSFCEIMRGLKAIFSQLTIQCDVDDVYSPPSLKISVEGPDTTKTKRYRWEINVFHTDDEQAMEDCSSYIAKDLFSIAGGAKLFYIIIFDNNADYDFET